MKVGKSHDRRKKTLVFGAENMAEVYLLGKFKEFVDPKFDPELEFSTDCPCALVLTEEVEE